MFAADDEESDEASVAKVADESSLSMNPNIMLLLLCIRNAKGIARRNILMLIITTIMMKISFNCVSFELLNDG